VRLTKENENSFSLEEKNRGESSSPPCSSWTIQYHTMKLKNKQLKRKSYSQIPNNQSMQYTSVR